MYKTGKNELPDSTNRCPYGTSTKQGCRCKQLTTKGGIKGIKNLARDIITGKNGRLDSTKPVSIGNKHTCNDVGEGNSIQYGDKGIKNSGIHREQGRGCKQLTTKRAIRISRTLQGI